MRFLLVVFFALVFGVSSSAVAQGISTIQDCDRALVAGTYNHTDSVFIDYRMAQHVDQQAYEQVRRQVGASATIYGVPMGANYSGFKENIQRYNSSQSVSWNINTFRNTAWSGLDANSVAAYTHCLNTLANLERRGVRLLFVRATDRDVVLQLRYVPQVPGSPSVLSLDWSYSGSRTLNLPKEIASAGETLILWPRPDVGQEDTLLVNSAAGAAEVSITGLPRPLPPPTRCEITSPHNPLPNLGPGMETNWRCSRLARGNYRLSASVTPSLPPGVYPVRVNFVLWWRGKDGSGGPLSSGTIDVGVNAGIPATASGSGTIDVPEGDIDIYFKASQIYSHQDFQNPNYGGIIVSSLHILLEQ